MTDSTTGPVATHRITAVVGNPKAGSRTLGAAAGLADALAGAIWGGQSSADPAGNDDVTNEVIDLADIADGLLAPWLLSPAATAATSNARSSDVLVLATPTYKASYTGLLKLFLDVFPAGSLSRTVVVPLIVSAGPAHRHLADIQLRPVLSELGAVIPAPSLLVQESELPQLDELIEAYVGQYGNLLAGTVRALVPETTAKNNS
jgi:FMN reductase